jgi:hypothetical protein
LPTTYRACPGDAVLIPTLPYWTVRVLFPTLNGPPTETDPPKTTNVDTPTLKELPPTDALPVVFMDVGVMAVPLGLWIDRLPPPAHAEVQEIRSGMARIRFLIFL